MIHLFSKCYLEIDNKIDIHTDRYVISKENGSDVWENIKDIQRGSLYGCQESIESDNVVSTLASIYFTLKDKEGKIIYYVDEESFPKFLAGWYKFLLPNLDSEEAANLYRAIVLYHNVYHRFVYQDFNNVEEFVLSEDPSIFLHCWDSLENAQYNDTEKRFKESILSSTSFEFKLPTFLYDGSMFEELEKVIRMFLRKDVENSFIQLREIFFSQFLDVKWSNLVGMNKSYTLENAHNVKSDGSDITELLFNTRIWNNTSLSLASTKTKTVNIDNITKEDVSTIIKILIDLRALSTTLCDPLNEETLEYPLMTAESFYLIEYLENIQNGFTPEQLMNFILKDNSYCNTESVFNGILYPTINSYINRHILANMDNKEFLKKYSLNKI